MASFPFPVGSSRIWLDGESTIDVVSMVGVTVWIGDETLLLVEDDNGNIIGGEDCCFNRLGVGDAMGIGRMIG